MRKDMKDIIVDVRGYHDSWGEQDLKYDGDYEDAPKKERMRTISTRRSGLRDAPLRRYLGKQVGRHWNQIWSEICEEADIRTSLGRRLRHQIAYYVETDLELVDGQLEAKTKWGMGYYYFGLYVHPETGILEEKKYEEHIWEKKPLTKFRRDNKAYEIVDGFWYEVWYESRMSMSFSVRMEEYVFKKRQLSANELRDLGIKNDNQK